MLISLLSLSLFVSVCLIVYVSASLNYKLGFQLLPQSPSLCFSTSLCLFMSFSLFYLYLSLSLFYLYLFISFSVSFSLRLPLPGSAYLPLSLSFCHYIDRRGLSLSTRTNFFFSPSEILINEFMVSLEKELRCIHTSFCADY